MFHADSHAIWRALMPVTRKGFKLRITSTPNGKGNKFYELMTDAQLADVWSRHTVDIYRAVADGLPLDIPTFRAAMNDEDGWAQEFELKWLDEASAWLSYELINGCEQVGAGLPATGGAAIAGKPAPTAKVGAGATAQFATVGADLAAMAGKERGQKERGQVRVSQKERGQVRVSQAKSSLTPFPTFPRGASIAAKAAPTNTAAEPVAALTARLAQEAAPAVADWLETIRAMLATAESLEEFEARLLAAWGDLPADTLAEVMAAGFTVAELAGRFEVAHGG